MAALPSDDVRGVQARSHGPEIVGMCFIVGTSRSFLLTEKRLCQYYLGQVSLHSCVEKRMATPWRELPMERAMHVFSGEHLNGSSAPVFADEISKAFMRSSRSNCAIRRRSGQIAVSKAF